MAKGKTGKRKTDAPTDDFVGEEGEVLEDDVEGRGKRRRAAEPDEDGDKADGLPLGDEEDLPPLTSTAGDYNGVFFGIPLEREVRPTDPDQRTMRELAHAVANDDEASVQPFVRAAFPQEDAVVLDPVVKAIVALMQQNRKAKRKTFDCTLGALLFPFGHVWLGTAPQRAKDCDHWDANAQKHFLGTKGADKRALVAMTPMAMIVKEPLVGFETYIRQACTVVTEERVPGSRKGKDGKLPTQTKVRLTIAPMITAEWDPLDLEKRAAMQPATMFGRPYIQGPMMPLMMTMDPMTEPFKEGSVDWKGNLVVPHKHAAMLYMDVGTPYDGAPVRFNADEFTPQLDPVAIAVMVFMERSVQCFLASCLMDADGVRRITGEDVNKPYVGIMEEEAKRDHQGWRHPNMVDTAVELVLRGTFGSCIDHPFTGDTESRQRVREALLKRVDEYHAKLGEGRAAPPLATPDTPGLRATFRLSDTRDI